MSLLWNLQPARIKLTYKLDGLKETLASLGQFKQTKVNEWARGGLKKAARVVVTSAKSRLQPGGRGYDTGLLRKSISFKAGTTKDGKRNYFVVGARRAVKRTKIDFGPHKVWERTLTKFGARLKGRQIGKDPANYIHLVEYGHRIAVGGTLTPIQRPGWTPELVWSEKLKTLVFKHGAPRRSGKSRRTGKYGEGRSSGFVPGIGFMRAAYDATKSQCEQIVKQHMLEAVQKHITKQLNKRFVSRRTA